MKTREQLAAKLAELQVIERTLRELRSTHGAALQTPTGFEVIPAETIDISYYSTAGQVEMLHWILETGRGHPKMQGNIDRSAGVAQECADITAIVAIPVPDTDGNDSRAASEN